MVSGYDLTSRDPTTRASPDSQLQSHICEVYSEISVQRGL